MLVKHILPEARNRLATIGADAPVTKAAELMSRPHIDLVVVCDAAGAMVGVLTKTDIVARIRGCSGSNCMTGVSAIMTREVAACRPDDWLRDVWQTMKERGLRRIPVVDDAGKPIGVVYARDALQSLLRETENEEALLRDYVMTVGYR